MKRALVNNQTAADLDWLLEVSELWLL